MSNQTEWRWADPAGQQRLVREDELRAALANGVIPSNAPVWTRGWKDWKAAHDVPELTEEAPAHGSPGSVPPPPNFIVAAQDAFEGKPAATPAGPAEPPPPPRYVPLDAKTEPHIPAPTASDTKVDAPRAAGKPATKPPPLPSKTPSRAPPPLPAAAKGPPPTKPTPPPFNKTVPMATKAATTTTKPTTTKSKPPPFPPQQPSGFKETQRPPAGVAPPSEDLPPSGGRHTLQIAPAPPPLPKLEVQAPPPVSVALPPQSLPAQHSKHPTLMMFEPHEPSQKLTAPEASAPIMVPANEPSAVTNAVTKPPPWGEGAVEMETHIPKSPPLPGAMAASRNSEAPRPMELSSSDLSSEARIAVVKAPPLVPAERPHGTMMGMGPAVLADNRAMLEPSPPRDAELPAPPLSQSDVASTSKWAPQHPSYAPSSQPPPRPPRTQPSGAKILDLRALTGLSAFATRAVATLRERTKDQPAWFLPALAGGGSLVLVLFLVVVVKVVSGLASSSPVAVDAAVTTGTGTVATTSSTSTGPPTSAKPMACQIAGTAHTVAPKALISSGVEVAVVASQVALGFAVAPKEAALEILEPGTLTSASALHLHATDNVRRVLALDATQAAVDGDHKGDRLQGRRTIRANPPIDLGAMDGGLVWAPHGSDKGVKLWSLVNPDAPVEALRGEPFSSAQHTTGYAVTYRSSGAVWYGAFAGNPPAPLAPLVHVDGLGPQVGSPAIAASGDHVMLAWADRASPNDFWSIRYLVFKVGDSSPPQPKSFVMPSGGLGEQAMSPSVAGLGEGRFLLVWTEGPVSNHQVRGAVMTDGAFNHAFTASTEGINAGQGQAVVLPDGRGVVAFLAASQTAKGFEVAATPIQCVEK